MLHLLALRVFSEPPATTIFPEKLKFEVMAQVLRGMELLPQLSFYVKLYKRKPLFNAKNSSILTFPINTGQKHKQTNKKQD